MKKLLTLALLLGAAFAQNNLHDFTPTAVGGASSTVLTVGPGVAFVGTTATSLAGVSLTLTTSSTNYVYVDLSGGTITFNTSGFSATTYPVAIAKTDAVHITSLTDVRPGTLNPTSLNVDQLCGERDDLNRSLRVEEK